jgi:hypothetical protein
MYNTYKNISRAGYIFKKTHLTRLSNKSARVFQITVIITFIVTSLITTTSTSIIPRRKYIILVELISGSF